MARMTGPDCAVMCNLINTHTHTHTRTHTHTHTLKVGGGSCRQSAALGASACSTMWYRGKNSVSGTGAREGGQEQGWGRYENEDEYRNEHEDGNEYERRRE